MAQGRREEWRMMLLLQAGAIGRLFEDDSLTETQLEQFIRTGSAGASAKAEGKEPRNPLADELVAQYLTTGKLIVE